MFTGFRVSELYKLYLSQVTRLNNGDFQINIGKRKNTGYSNEKCYIIPNNCWYRYDDEDGNIKHQSYASVVGDYVNELRESQFIQLSITTLAGISGY